MMLLYTSMCKQEVPHVMFSGTVYNKSIDVCSFIQGGASIPGSYNPFADVKQPLCASR